MAVKKPCKDCFPDLRPGEVLRFRPRPAPHPGPRCSTHHKEAKAKAKKASHEAYVLKTYGLKAGEYDKLYAAQGGVCYICQLAKGLRKKLSVDHDHKTGYVRGLLCGPCNKFIGYIRDSGTAGYRVGDYLTSPPAFDIIGKRKPDG